MIILYTAAYFITVLYLLWIFYIAVMNLKRARISGALTKTATVLGVPVLAIGLILDFLANIGPMTLLLLELPKETTVTARLKRHNRNGKGWRKAVAAWAEPLLDPFDPSGDHI